MATTDVSICNAALAMIGLPVSISSLDDATVQGRACNAFYTQCLNTVLAEHAWSFATVTVLLNLLASPNQLWAYAYQAPGDMVQALAVYENDAQGDVTGTYASNYPLQGTMNGYQAMLLPGLSNVTQQDFSIENDGSGGSVIYTNQQNAMLKYVQYQKNASGFPPMFVETFTCMLASKLAGALIKGDVGVTAMKTVLQAYDFWLGKAKEKDGGNRVDHPVHVPLSIAIRA